LLVAAQPMPSIFDLFDAVAAALWAGMPTGFDGEGPGLVLAVLGLGGWLRWVVMSVRRALDD
jgi:hypothetical protein